MRTRKTFGAVPAKELTDARLQLHHAVQLLAAFGQTLVAPRDDDSHRSMTWDAHGRRFVSEGAEQHGELKVGLRARGLTVSLLRGGTVVSESTHRFDGIESMYAWLEREIGKAVGASGPVVLDRPEYELPDHAVARGEPFSRYIDVELGELEAWFTYANDALGRLTSAEVGSTPQRCWPHHFDLATLILLDPASAASEGRSVGVGFSPGDAAIDQPYWYVNAYPRPDIDVLPALPDGGHWNTEGWFGAVLRGDRIVEAGARDRSAHSALTDDFLREAVESVKDILLTR